MGILRDTYKYWFKVGSLKVHCGITNNLHTRENQHRNSGRYTNYNDSRYYWSEGHIAQEEADNKYPLDNVGITMEDIKRNGAYNERLKEKYEKVLATEFGIDIAIIDSIGIEGLKKGWPFPQK